MSDREKMPMPEDYGAHPPPPTEAVLLYAQCLIAAEACAQPRGIDDVLLVDLERVFRAMANYLIQQHPGLAPSRDELAGP